MKLATIKNIYCTLNAKNFGGVLTMPRIGFNRSRINHAHYDGEAMKFNLCDTKGIIQATELVYHEMTHQYIDEFLKLVDVKDHGKEFKKQYNKFCTGIEMDSEYKF